MADWVIEPLTAAHERSSFTCGNSHLDTFLRTLVGQYEKRRLGRTFVATQAGQRRVAGFYTLAAGSFDISSLPASERKKFPKHALPTVHLGRLAVDVAYRGQRLGETLLMHALRASVEISKSLGAFAVDVSAKDDGAREFYARYGFLTLADNPLRLYLPMKTIAAMFGK